LFFDITSERHFDFDDLENSNEVIKSKDEESGLEEIEEEMRKENKFLFNLKIKIE